MKNSKIIQLANGKFIKLRHINRNDIDQIWENFNEVIEEGIYLPTFEKVESEYEKRTWFYDLKDAGNLCLVAVDMENGSENSIVGQCTIEHIQWEASKHVAVLGIIIRSDFRNLHLGYELMQFAMDEALLIGKEKIILSTFETNKNAIHLYEKLGFKIVGKRMKHFKMNGKYINELLMEIWIGN